MDLPNLDVRLTQVIKHAEPYTVEVTRYKDGSTGWKVEIHAATAGDAIERLTELCTNLQKYLTPQP